MPNKNFFDENELIPYRSKKKKIRKPKANHKHQYDVHVILKEYYNHHSDWLYMHAYKCSLCDEITFSKIPWHKNGEHFKTDEEVRTKYPDIEIIEKEL